MIFFLGYFYHNIVVSRCTVPPLCLPSRCYSPLPPSFVRLFRSPLLVALFFRTSPSSLFLRCGCFGRPCWLHCSSARFSLYYFASWLFRSPLLVELSFRTLFSLAFCAVVVSVAFVGCTVLPHPFSVLFVRCGCFGRLCWLHCSSARSSSCIPSFSLSPPVSSALYSLPLSILILCLDLVRRGSTPRRSWWAGLV